MAEKTHTSRLSSYKNAGHGANDLRRKRVELSVALRKQARDEQLLKRRALSPEPGDEVQNEKTYSPANVVQGLKSPDLATKTAAARAGRRMLSKEQNPPITPMVAAGIIPPLVEALDRDDCSDLQFEAAWALTNIASGTSEHTMAVVDGGAVPKLITLLSHGGAVAEQAAWALGNIAGDGPLTRDLVLNHGALPAILPYLTVGTPQTQLRTNVWTYSNLCRNKNPLVKFEYVAPALPYVAELLAFDDQDVLADACWALSYLTDGPNDRIEAVQSTPQLTERLIALLGYRTAAVKTPALRALGNMLTGSDVQTDRCIEAGCIPHIITLLQCSKPSLVKEAAWAASNILAGTPAQIEAALRLEIHKPLVHVLINGDAKSKNSLSLPVLNSSDDEVKSQRASAASTSKKSRSSTTANARPTHRSSTPALSSKKRKHIPATAPHKKYSMYEIFGTDSEDEQQDAPPKNKKSATSPPPSPRDHVKASARDVFGSDSDDEITSAGKKQPTIYSYFSKRVTNGVSRQSNMLKEGSHYIELKVYNCEEIRNVQPMNRWRHAIITIKNRTNDDTEAWNHLTEYIRSTRKETRPDLIKGC